MGGGEMGGGRINFFFGGEDQWKAWNRSCDLRANEKPWKKLHPMAQTDRQTDTHKDGHHDSMTESADLKRDMHHKYVETFCRNTVS